VNKIGIYVILWHYSDGSGHGAVCYCLLENEAKAVLALLEEHATGKQFTIEFVRPSDNLAG